jgi:hypothetical protein
LGAPLKPPCSRRTPARGSAGRVERRARELRGWPPRLRLHARERLRHLLAVVADLLGVLVVVLAHALQQVGKPGMP